MRPAVALSSLCLAALVPLVAGAQQQTSQFDILKREIELLKRENDLLRRENELLKKEVETLRKAGTAKGAPSTETGDAVLSATVDDVEYVYQGIQRSGTNAFVVVLGTSKSGNHQAPLGKMTIIDSDGERYTGLPLGAGLMLREGIPVRLQWRFGTNPLFGGKTSAPPPRIATFAGVLIENGFGFGGGRPIEFRNVPAVLKK